MSFIVAVDGPAGSGKGTVTKRIEKEMGLINIDTGAMYRCVALESLKRGFSVDEDEKIINMLDDIKIDIENEGEIDKIILNGEDVSKRIRENDVTNIVSKISSIIKVREKMVELQRKLAEGKNVIMEGRDIGTVVFPKADLKIYLDASEEVRAIRRFKENQEKNIEGSYEEILDAIRKRDEMDRNKKVGALKKADDAIVVDSSNLSIDEVVEKIKNLINEKMKKEK